MVGDVKTAIRLSDDALEHAFFAMPVLITVCEHFQFPVLPSVRLIRLINEEIQSVFEFITLCRRPTENGSDIVGDELVEPVCLIPFLLYINARCQLALRGPIRWEEIFETLDELSRYQVFTHKIEGIEYVFVWMALCSALFVRVAGDHEARRQIRLSAYDEFVWM